ncbi:MAG: 2-hydroxyglutaryl-CoA dehydratase [Syntrophothermus sp.]|uniref:acyl-CoA dehydratase activase-related protein n=1 Tax=Syntrophothermus sp. TaxID=2736299 RepID=UPI0025805B27|nr:acyl-CoA dehydratase activase-related protein [Syntrophothermus sp.]NSW83839.1 2-hydroxyglutaryl-CoA dehydratase [Syntrophothermus sp.]
MARIGIPRTLAYFLYFPFCREFFGSLGHEVVTSPPTSKLILDEGMKEAVSEACIPIKVFHGHVKSLIGQVDYIFAPRLVSLRKFGDFGTETFCPKFLGLPDMLKASVSNLPDIIDTRIDLKRGWREIVRVGMEIGKILGASRSKVWWALARAQMVQKRFQRLLLRGLMPEEAMEIVFDSTSTLAAFQKLQPEFRVAVVGYPYLIYDTFLNVGLLDILRRENVAVYTQDMLSWHKLKVAVRGFPKHLFWFFSNRALEGALHFMGRKEVDGVIHVTAFACGPDAMVDRLMELEAKKRGQIPFMSIMVDEHTGEAGIRTRIEAFVDMLRYRRAKNED